MEAILRGLLGVAVMIGFLYLLSSNKKAIDWKLVIMALLLQLVFCVAVLKVEFVKAIFNFIASFFVSVLSFTKEGASFLFGGLLDTSSVGYVFACQVLPTIIFFSALSSMLFYLGILQRIVYGIAVVMSKVMRLSGAESTAAAANIFIGQTEAPLLIKPYIEKMTRSETLCLMVGGMATIAGGVLAAYIGFLGGESQESQQDFATHLLTASIMSAPAAILAAKMLCPETEEVDTNLEVSKDKLGSNLLDAIAIGTNDGLRLAVNVGAMLIVFIALMAMFNAIFSSTVGSTIGWGLDGSWSFFASDPNVQAGQIVKWDNATKQWMLYAAGAAEPTGVANITRISLNMYVNQITEGRFAGFNLEYLLGLIMSPVAWILGASTADMGMVGQLLGKKVIINEFVAYADIPAISEHISYKSKIIATYALCGFSNFASIGIQIGGIGALAPNKRPMLAELGVKALIGGSIACFLTAAIAGMMYDH